MEDWPGPMNRGFYAGFWFLPGLDIVLINAIFTVTACQNTFHSTAKHYYCPTCNSNFFETSIRRVRSHKLGFTGERDCICMNLASKSPAQSQTANARMPGLSIWPVPATVTRAQRPSHKFSVNLDSLLFVPILLPSPQQLEGISRGNSHAGKQKQEKYPVLKKN